MSHPLCGCLLAGSAYFYFGTRRGGSLWAVAGMLGGILAATQVRPLTGALFGLVLGLCAIWEVRHCRRRLLETMALCGLFAAAAAYAAFRDREKRTEALVLASLFGCLVAGYAPDRYPSGSLLGERFYFEGFFAVALLAARGLTLLAQNWDVAGWLPDCLGLLATSSVATLLFTLPAIFHEVEPYASVRLAAEQVKLPNAVVFLQPHDPEFVAKHFNLNRADWPSAPLFFAPDPGPDARPVLARALGRPAWVVITYDPSLHKAQVSAP